MADFATLSDAQLLAAAQKAGVDVSSPTPAPTDPASIYGAMSNADLLQVARDKGVQIAPPPFKPTDPTEGMSTPEVMLAAGQKTLKGLGIGALERVYEAFDQPFSPWHAAGLTQKLKPWYDQLQQSVAESRERDAPLMNRAGSGWGEFLAGTAPMLALGGIPAAAAGLTFGALQPTAPGESPIGNMAAGALAGPIGQKLGTLAGAGGRYLMEKAGMATGAVKQALEDILPAMRDGRAGQLYDQVPTAPGAEQPFPAKSFLDRLPEIYSEFEDKIPKGITNRIEQFRAGQLANEGQIPAPSGQPPRDMTIGEASKFNKLINTLMGDAAPKSAEAKAATALRGALNSAGDELGTGSGGNLAWQTFRQANKTFQHDATLDELQAALEKGPGKLGKAMDEIGADRLASALSPQELSRLSVLRMADQAQAVKPHTLSSMALGALGGHALEHMLHEVPLVGPFAGALVGMGVDKAMQRAAQQRAMDIINPATLGELAMQRAGAAGGAPAAQAYLPNPFGQNLPQLPVFGKAP